MPRRFKILWVVALVAAAAGLPARAQNCLAASAGGGWVNNGAAAQTGTFTATFDATPSAAPTNAIVGLSSGPQSALTGFAVLILFDTDSRIKARNGGAYPPSTVPYAAGIAYHFRLEVDVAAHRYAAYVTPDGGSELTIGTQLAFRTEQAVVSRLDNWGAFINDAASGTGSVRVCSFGPGACGYALAPTSASATAAGTSGSVDISTSPACPWLATTSKPAWLSLALPISGVGSGRVSYAVAANTGVARSARLAIGNRSFTVSQANGCSYTVDPASAWPTPSGGSASVGVQAGSGCPWTAASNTPGWLTVTGGASGSGSGSVAYAVSANTGPARSGSLSVAGRTVSVEQAAAGCSYAIAPASVAVTGAAATLVNIGVSTGAGCTWGATSNAPAWLGVAGAPHGSGSGGLGVVAAPNAGAARNGTLTIGGRTLSVAQSAAPLEYVYGDLRKANLGAGADLNGAMPFPADNAWNTDISAAPRDPNSDAIIASIGLDIGLRNDFGSGTWNGSPIGIPYVVVPGTQPPVPIVFTDYGYQSDPGPYPVPADAPIEGGPASSGDRHVLVIDRDHARLYEMGNAYPLGGGAWQASGGAVFHLDSNVVRPGGQPGWTSTDAAGLPVFPGLARYEEAARGPGGIRHALRFTATRTRRAYVPPATHWASSDTNPDLPPMGMRVRLKASYVIPASFSTAARALLTAMKTYGLMLADNGSNWYVSGAPDERWDNARLISELGSVKGSNFEVVRMDGIVTP